MHSRHPKNYCRFKSKNGVVSVTFEALTMNLNKNISRFDKDVWKILGLHTITYPILSLQTMNSKREK